MRFETEESELRAIAKIAKSINWNVINNWREKLGAQSNLEMVMDYDTGAYYESKQLIRRSPFQSHVRLNLDKMIFSGSLEKEDVVQYYHIETKDEDTEDTE
jgi:hypothetical protein